MLDGVNTTSEKTSYKTMSLSTFNFSKTISSLEWPLLTFYPDVKCIICIFQMCSHELSTVIKIFHK